VKSSLDFSANKAAACPWRRCNRRPQLESWPKGWRAPLARERWRRPSGESGRAEAGLAGAIRAERQPKVQPLASLPAAGKVKLCSKCSSRLKGCAFTWIKVIPFNGLR